MSRRVNERPIDLVLSRLNNVKRGRKGYQACCPAHDDANPSLSVSEGSDGRVLLKCHAGCTTEEVVRAMGLTMADLFPTTTSKHAVITVAELAADKGIPESFLHSLGITNSEEGVVVPYKLQGGSPAPRTRLRTALKAKEGSRWLRGSGRPVPYGLDRLDAARKRGYLILVEGESDCWTLWRHEYPALGLPGADTTSLLDPAYFTGIGRVYVVREPDSAGDKFVRGVQARLGPPLWPGELRVLACGDAKDPNDLYRRDPDGFRRVFDALLESAPLLDSSNPTDPAASQPDQLLRDAGLMDLPTTPELGAVEVALRRLADLLPGSDPLRRAVARATALAHLTNLKVAAPAKLVDAAFKTAADSGPDSAAAGHELILSDPIPADDAVSGVVVLDAICSTLRRYLVLPEGAAEAIALWILHAHAFDATSISPFLTLSSPLKRCGKTTVITIVNGIVPRALPSSNITPAVLFRAIEKYKPTFLIDEADTFVGDNPELRGILNAGHTRTTAFVLRTVGEDHDPRTFSVWCPKLVAGVGRPPDTIEDRSIVVTMRRRAKHEKVARLRLARIDAELEPLRGMAARWALDNVDALRDADPEVPDELHDRAQDNWRPLLAIADQVGGDWPERARQAALHLMKSAPAEDQSDAARLLADLRDIFILQGSPDHLSSATILQALQAIEDAPWRDWGKGLHGLTLNGLAKLLKPFRVKPRTVRLSERTPKGYRLADLQDAFSRYLPPQPQQPQQERDGDEIRTFPNRNTPPSVAVVKTQKKIRNDNVVAPVAAPRRKKSRKLRVEPKWSGNSWTPRGKY